MSRKDFAKKYSFYYQRDLLLDEPRRALAAAHWPSSEISYSIDSAHYQSFLSSAKNQDMITFVDNILVLFSNLDGMVIENLFENFIHELSEYKEIRDFFIVQENNELVHSQSYGDQLIACIKNTQKLNAMIEADPTRYPAVNEVTQWTARWFDTTIPIVERLIAFACVEGIIFTAAFVAIYRLKELNVFPGICKANEFISKDEAMHTSAGIHFFKYLCKQFNTFVSQERAHEIIKSATELSCRFAEDAVQPNLIGLQLNDLKKYMRLSGNKLANEFGYANIYLQEEVGCAFEWMSKICMMNLSNFFETRPTEYQTHSNTNEDLNVNLDEVEF